MATPIKVNRIGLEPQIYKGGKTTLCAGCGHNAISERIIDAFYEMGIDPKQVIKLSGIGCSSKSPAYFLAARTASTPCTAACRQWVRARCCQHKADCHRRSAVTATPAPSASASSCT
jgi:hypothetical protein